SASTCLAKRSSASGWSLRATLSWLVPSYSSWVPSPSTVATRRKPVGARAVKAPLHSDQFDNGDAEARDDRRQCGLMIPGNNEVDQLGLSVDAWLGLLRCVAGQRHLGPTVKFGDHWCRAGRPAHARPIGRAQQAGSARPCSGTP